MWKDEEIGLKDYSDDEQEEEENRMQKNFCFLKYRDENIFI